MKKSSLRIVLCLTLCLAMCLAWMPTAAHAETTGWYQQDGNWYYSYDGENNATGRVYVDDNWYFFDENGVMKTGWIQEGYTWYYGNANGALAVGWKTISGKTYYFYPWMASGTQYIDDSLYLFTQDGPLGVAGWNKVVYTYTYMDGDGVEQTVSYDQWYYCNADGTVKTGWQKIGGNWYYFYDDGTMAAQPGGTEQINGKIYFFKEGGALGSAGWNKRVYTYTYTDGNGEQQTDTSTSWYYCDADGVAATGWQKIGGTWYYFSEWGDMYSDGTYTINEKKYLFKESGALAGAGWNKHTYNWSYVDENGETHQGSNTEWYYCDANGVVATGWQKIGGNWYYFDENGWMYSDCVSEVDGKKYLFKESGALASSGWNKLEYTYTTSGGTEVKNTEWIYCDANGVVQTGWQKIGGNWYYFSEWGDMYSDGTYTINEKKYLFKESGALASSGWNKLEYTYTTSGGTEVKNTEWFYCDANGVVATGWKQIGGNWYYFSEWGDMYSDGTYTINEKKYLFKESGTLANAGWQTITRNEDGETVTHTYYVNSDGTLVEGWKQINGKWYYFDYEMLHGGLYEIDGKLQYFNDNGVWVETTSSSNWRTVGSNTRYVKANGEYATGWMNLDGKDYYFDSYGNLQSGWVKSGGKWYYCDPSTYTDGCYEIDGKLYFFNASGAMQTGTWIKDAYTYEGRSYVYWYSSDSNGVLTQGWKKISGSWYYFDPEMVFDTYMDIDGVQYLFGPSGAWTGESW